MLDFNSLMPFRTCVYIVTFVQFSSAVMAIATVITGVRAHYANGKQLTPAGRWLIAAFVAYVCIVIFAFIRDMSEPLALNSIDAAKGAVMIARTIFGLCIFGLAYTLMAKPKFLEHRPYKSQFCDKGNPVWPHKDDSIG